MAISVQAALKALFAKARSGPEATWENCVRAYVMYAATAASAKVVQELPTVDLIGVLDDHEQHIAVVRIHEFLKAHRVLRRITTQPEYVVSVRDALLGSKSNVALAPETWAAALEAFQQSLQTSTPSASTVQHLRRILDHAGKSDLSHTVSPSPTTTPLDALERNWLDSDDSPQAANSKHIKVFDTSAESVLWTLELSASDGRSSIIDAYVTAVVHDDDAVFRTERLEDEAFRYLLEYEDVATALLNALYTQNRFECCAACADVMRDAGLSVPVNAVSCAVGAYAQQGRLIDALEVAESQSARMAKESIRKNMADSLVTAFTASEQPHRHSEEHERVAERVCRAVAEFGVISHVVAPLLRPVIHRLRAGTLTESTAKIALAVLLQAPDSQRDIEALLTPTTWATLCRVAVNESAERRSLQSFQPLLRFTRDIADARELTQAVMDARSVLSHDDPSNVPVLVGVARTSADDDVVERALASVSPFPWLTALAFIRRAESSTGNVNHLRTLLLQSLVTRANTPWNTALGMVTTMRTEEAAVPMTAALRFGKERSAAKKIAEQHLNQFGNLEAHLSVGQHSRRGVTSSVAKIFEEMDHLTGTGQWVAAAHVFMSNRSQLTAASQLQPIIPAIQRIPAVTFAALLTLIVAEESLVEAPEAWRRCSTSASRTAHDPPHHPQSRPHLRKHRRGSLRPRTLALTHVTGRCPPHRG
jgi:hypothetical protein